MAFVRTVKPPKQSYDATDHAWADAVIALRKTVEPRCNNDAPYCLSLLRRGPFVTYTGSGADAGKLLHLSFLRKPNNRLRLAYIAPDGFQNTPQDRQDLRRLVGRTVKDALDLKQISAVYWYVENDAPNSVNKAIMSSVGNRIGEVFPEVSVTEQVRGGFTFWGAAIP